MLAPVLVTHGFSITHTGDDVTINGSRALTMIIRVGEPEEQEAGGMSAIRKVRIFTRTGLSVSNVVNHGVCHQIFAPSNTMLVGPCSDRKRAHVCAVAGPQFG